MGIEAIRWKALQALRPPADLPLADWIEGHIFLPQNASALPGRMKLWAYQRGICDALDSPDIERVTVLKSARIGYPVRQTPPQSLPALLKARLKASRLATESASGQMRLTPKPREESVSPSPGRFRKSAQFRLEPTQRRSFETKPMR